MPSRPLRPPYVPVNRVRHFDMRIYESLNVANRVFREGVTISVSKDPLKRSVIKNSALRDSIIDCEIDLGNAELDNVLLKDLKFGQRGRIVGNGVYRGLRVEGAVGELNLLHSVGGTPEEQAVVNAARAKYYESFGEKEFAADFTQARLSTPANLSGLPGLGNGRVLVRLDPATQAIVTSERLESADLSQIDFGATGWKTTIALMKREGRESHIFIVPLEHDRADEYQRVLDQMNALGLTEPLTSLERASTFNIA